jgi:hypothetical protein
LKRPVEVGYWSFKTWTRKQGEKKKNETIMLRADEIILQGTLDAV